MHNVSNLRTSPASSNVGSALSSEFSHRAEASAFRAKHISSATMPSEKNLHDSNKGTMGLFPRILARLSMSDSETGIEVSKLTRHGVNSRRGVKDPYSSGSARIRKVFNGQ